MERVICYIDGYNFFHATKDKPTARINFASLATSFLDSPARRLGEKQLVKVCYFSAIATWRTEDAAKHKSYINALKQTGVEVILSHFKKKQRKCLNCNAKWQSHEEKESDVRIALHILEDVFDNKFDTAFILSGDSDLVPVIEKVKSRHPDKRILVALPKHSLKYARDITRCAHGFVNLSPSRLKKHTL